MCLLVHNKDRKTVIRKPDVCTSYGYIYSVHSHALILLSSNFEIGFRFHFRTSKSRVFRHINIIIQTKLYSRLTDNLRQKVRPKSLTKQCDLLIKTDSFLVILYITFIYPKNVSQI